MTLSTHLNIIDRAPNISNLYTDLKFNDANLASCDGNKLFRNNYITCNAQIINPYTGSLELETNKHY